MVNPIPIDPMFETRLYVRELARKSGLLLDNDEILVIFQNVRYTLNQKLEILTQMKATEFEKRMFEAARPLHGRRKGEYSLSVTQRNEEFVPMIEAYMTHVSGKVKDMMLPIVNGIINDVPRWREENRDVVPIHLRGQNG